MTKSFVSIRPMTEFPLWKKLGDKRALCTFELEITARCNLNCRHCYINLPAGDRKAKKEELSPEQVKKIAGDAVSLGAIWCLVTGGEPLVRKDFFDIYLTLKKRGLLVSVFTNATLVTEEHVTFFKKYPPRAIEVTVYGATPETYERVTRKPGSYKTFRRGLDLLLGAGLKVSLKTMALRSNIHEMEEISRFCRERNRDFYRFDPFLHLRYDGDPARNRDILSERLSPEEIVALEKSDPSRFEALKKNVDILIDPKFSKTTCNRLFRCGAGKENFCVSYNGVFRFCSSLWHPECVFDLKTGSLAETWERLFIKVRNMKSDRKEFIEKCRACPIVNLCMWCPAFAYLETGELDVPVNYFCRLAHAREKALKKR